MKTTSLFRVAGAVVLAWTVGCSSHPSSEGSPEPKGQERESETAAVVEQPLAPAAPDTVTLTASQDTSIRLSGLNRNFGRELDLDVNRALVRFDPAAINAAVGPQDFVTDARLELVLTNNALRQRAPSRAVSVFRMTTAWTELGATWNCAIDTNTTNARADCSGATNWSMGPLQPNPWATPLSASATVSPNQTGVVRFDMTSDVRAFARGAVPNQGWILMSPVAGEFAEFASRETGTPPKLVLTVRRCSASLCDDGNACTIDSCDAAANCVHANAPNGASCSDGNACSQVDSCQGGTCVGTTPVTCVALDQCHVAGACDPGTGVCSNPAQVDGTACSDGNACTQVDSCQTGTCVGASPVTCLAQDQCHVSGVCNPASGLCSSPAAPDGTPCSDGTGCTQGDSCQGAACVAGQAVCGVVVINEVESNGGVPGDWVELYNAGSASVDISGWKFKDNDDTHSYAIPAGTILAPGSYYMLEEAAFGFGLGAADSARLFDPNVVTVIDSYTWTAHAATTYGRCPNGSGGFTTSASVTKSAANACGSAADGGADASTDAGSDANVDAGAEAAADGGAPASSVVINEVESNGGVPGDWVELYNAGSASVDISGWKFKDGDDNHAFYSIPAATILAPGAYYLLEEAQFGFGLGTPDAARLFDPTGTTVIDSYSWTPHAATTYGRCPNGTGPFTTTGSSTKGAANDCSLPSEGGVDAGADVGADADGGGLTFSPWPGQDMVTTVDPAGTYPSNLSGLFYESGSPSMLWAVQNDPSTLYRLVYDGVNWVSGTDNGWGIGKTLFYPSGGGRPDSEGVTRAELSSPAIYVATERDNGLNTVSRLSILRFDSSASGTTLTATHEWNLTADLPPVGPNLGLEGITWVPDAYLVANSFFDESRGVPYDPAFYANHGTGLFFVGVEANGAIHAYALDHVGGTFRRIATFASGHGGVMDVAFDRDVGQLWAWCDNTCGNKATVLAVVPATGQFTIRAAFNRPSTMADINNEGIAFAPESECSGGMKSFFWSDDSSTSGHAIRRDTIRCGPLP